MSPIRRDAASALCKRRAHDVNMYVQARIIGPVLFCLDAWNMEIRSEIQISLHDPVLHSSAHNWHTRLDHETS